MICIHYRVPLNFDHKNYKGLKHSDEEETRKERTKTKGKGGETEREKETG